MAAPVFLSLAAIAALLASASPSAPAPPAAADSRLAAHAATRRAPPEPRTPADLLIDFGTTIAHPGEVVTVSVHVRDAAGKPTDATVAMDSDSGEVGAVERAQEGLYRARLTVPTALPGTRSLFVIAHTGGVSADAILPLSPGPAATLRLAGPATLAAGRLAPLQIDVAVLDAFGNPAEVTPAAHALHGVVGKPARVGPGRWVVDYQPRRVSDDVDDEVSVEAGATRGTHLVRLLAAADWASFAPRLGAAFDAGGAGLAVSGEASMWHRLDDVRVGFALDVAWWSLGRAGTARGPGGPLSLSGDRSYLPLTASAAAGRALGSRLSAWGSLGGGAALVMTTARLSGQPSASEAGWAPAATAALGLDLRAGMGAPFVEVRGSWIGDPRLKTLSGSVWPILVQLGYRFDAR
jgi:hypothetical protein